MNGLNRLGGLQVTCVPIVGYEGFAKNLGVDPNLISQPARPLPKDNLYYWNFDVGYQSKNNNHTISSFHVYDIDYSDFFSV